VRESARERERERERARARARERENQLLQRPPTATTTLPNVRERERTGHRCRGVRCVRHLLHFPLPLLRLLRRLLLLLTHTHSLFGVNTALLLPPPQQLVVESIGRGHAAAGSRRRGLMNSDQKAHAGVHICAQERLDAPANAWDAFSNVSALVYLRYKRYYIGYF
jgi:hypothetical protein